MHGRFKDYFKIINLLDQSSIQLGDTLLGFPDINIRTWDKNHKFIRRKSL